MAPMSDHNGGTPPIKLQYSSRKGRFQFLGGATWIRSLFGRALNLLIIYFFWNVVIVCGGVGPIGYVIRFGAPNAWGSLIPFSKICLVLLATAALTPFIDQAEILSLVGGMGVFVMWVSFLYASDFSFWGLIAIHSMPFLIAVFLRLFAAVVRIERRLRQHQPRGVSEILSFFITLAVAALLSTFWVLHHAADFEKS